MNYHHLAFYHQQALNQWTSPHLTPRVSDRYWVVAVYLGQPRIAIEALHLSAERSNARAPTEEGSTALAVAKRWLDGEEGAEEAVRVAANEAWGWYGRGELAAAWGAACCLWAIVDALNGQLDLLANALERGGADVRSSIHGPGDPAEEHAQQLRDLDDLLVKAGYSLPIHRDS